MTQHKMSKFLKWLSFNAIVILVTIGFIVAKRQNVEQAIDRFMIVLPLTNLVYLFTPWFR